MFIMVILAIESLYEFVSLFSGTKIIKKLNDKQCGHELLWKNRRMVFGVGKGRHMPGKESVWRFTLAAYNSLSGMDRINKNKPCEDNLRRIYRSNCFKTVYTCP